MEDKKNNLMNQHNELLKSWYFSHVFNVLSPTFFSNSCLWFIFFSSNSPVLLQEPHQVVKSMNFCVTRFSTVSWMSVQRWRKGSPPYPTLLSFSQKRALFYWGIYSAQHWLEIWGGQDLWRLSVPGYLWDRPL